MYCNSLANHTILFLVFQVLKFMYYGQVVVRYDEMEGFLHTCKFLGIRLFKPPDVTAEGLPTAEEGNPGGMVGAEGDPKAVAYQVRK